VRRVQAVVAPADDTGMTVALLSLCLLPLSALALVWALRAAALRDGAADPARGWFGFWRGATAVLTGIWIGWPALVWTSRAAAHAATALGDVGVWGVALVPLAVYGLVPALVTVAVAAMSHAVSARLRGAEWTMRETVAQSAWSMAGLVGPLACLALAVPAWLTGQPRLVVAFALAAVATRAWCVWRLGRAADLAPHAVTVGPLRDRVYELAAAAGVRLGMLYVLPAARGRIANAFAVRRDVVVLTDYLLRHLTRREVDAILAHELVHLKKGHPHALGITAAVATVAVLVAGGSLAPGLLWPLALFVSLLASVTVSRRFERQADLGAARLTGDPEALIAALGALSRLNHLPLDWGAWTGRLLTHPSTLRRARTVARAHDVPEARMRELLRHGCGDAAHHELPATAAGKAFSSRFKAEWSARIGLAVALAQVLAAAATVAVAAWLWPAAPRTATLALGTLAALFAALGALDLLAARPYAGVRRALEARLAAEGLETADAEFVGLAPSDEGYVYEGFTDWDAGLLWVRGDRLCYCGEETRFTLRRDEVIAVRLGARLPGWIGAPRVVIDWRGGALSLRAARVATVRAGRDASWRLLGRLGAWLDGLDAGDAPGARSWIDAPGPPAFGVVTAQTPREVAHPATLVPVAVVTALLALAVCGMAGLPLAPWRGAGALDVAAAAFLASVAQRVPWWAWRPEHPTATARRESERHAA
jgi:heat shock protein HtpX